jgi:hypothetical protein
MTPFRLRFFGLGVLALSLALASCSRQTESPASSSPPASSSSPPPVMPAKRTHSAVFDHTQPEHSKMTCESCHARSLSNPSRVEPERSPHTACSGCHSSENYLDTSTSEPLCATCHPANQILDVSRTTRVLPFPERLNQFGVRAFSHRDHMDEAKMSPHPASYGCEYCHAGVVGAAPKRFPAHNECYGCHIHQAGQKFGRCEDCHAAAKQSIAFSHAPGAADRDYNFRHSGHTKRKDGSPIPCATCHGLKTETQKLSDIARIEPTRGLHHTSSCWGTCHMQKEETRCEKCHVAGVPIVAKVR